MRFLPSHIKSFRICCKINRFEIFQCHVYRTSAFRINVNKHDARPLAAENYLRRTTATWCPRRPYSESWRLSMQKGWASRVIPHSKERAASSSSRWPDCTKTTESRAEHDMADRALAESQLTSGRSASLVSGIHVRCCFLKALFASKLQCLRFEHEACTHCYVVLSSR